MTRDRALCAIGLHRWVPHRHKYLGRQWCIRAGCFALRDKTNLDIQFIAICALGGIVVGVVFTTLLFMVAG